MCYELAKKKCADAEDDTCMPKAVGMCKMISGNKCAMKVAKKCKDSDEPKKCFWEGAKKCKKF